MATTEIPDPPSPAAPIAPAEPISGVLICLIIITVCVAGAVAMVLRPVITPLLIGLLLFFLVNPLAQYFDERNVPRWLTYVVILVVGAAAVYGVGCLVEIQGKELQDRLPQYQQRAHEALNHYARMFGFANKDGKFDEERYSLTDMSPVSQDQMVKYVVESMLDMLELCTMAFFYLLFALMESDHAARRMQRSLSTDSASHVWSVIGSIKTDMRRYLWVKTAISAGLAATTALVGWLFGLDFWMLWGLLMFLANYITYIGSIVAIAPPMLVAFAQFDNALAAGGLCAVLIIARLVWIDYAEMKYSGAHVNVNPLLVLFSVALMGWMWNVVGMLLAVPVITTTRIVLASFPRTKFMARLMSNR